MSISKLLTIFLTGCASVVCGPGTIQREGTCEPADETVGSGACGPGTTLEGDSCVPTIQCDPSTTMPVVDPTTGQTTCVAIGNDCSAPIACPPPTPGNQTLCGQLYDLDDQTPFAVAGAKGDPCMPGATSGPCAIAIEAFDAAAFVSDPTNTPPLATGGVEIDDCGRFRLDSVQVPATSPLIGLGFDDADMTARGPAGLTNSIGIAVAKDSGVATQGIEGYIAASTTTDAWAASGGPTIDQGIYADIFRAHLTGLDPQAGVTVLKGAGTIHPNDFYFAANDTTRETIDTTSQMTGANGTALLIGQNGLGYNGMGGLQTDCVWTNEFAASVPNIVFVQVTRPTDQPGHTCAQ